MNKDKLLVAILSGKPIILVEYRKCEFDIIRRNAPKTGQSPTMPQLKHTVLVGDVSYEVTEWLESDKGYTVGEVKPMFARGTRCAVELESMEKTKYGNRIEGRIIAVEGL